MAGATVASALRRWQQSRGRSSNRQNSVTETEIRDWCIAYLRRTLDDPSVTVEADASFAEMGLDSASSAYFIVALEERLGGELDPELVFDHPTIALLARHLAGQQRGGDAGAG